MHLPSKSVYNILVEKEITELYHANSVLTACQFLREKCLLGRGIVEQLGYNQTAQDSDDADMRYSVWYDVFVDTVDIHNRARTCNIYGPVLFVFDTDLIYKTYTGKIWVTKSNPISWSGKTEEERWFQSRAELSKELVKGRFEQMLVFRHSGGRLSLKTHLKKIILDDPQRKISGVDLYSLALGSLSYAMEVGGIKVPIEKRKCRLYCNCLEKYSSDRNLAIKMFDPRL